MALSGGVDSAVSAALLQKEGYDVRAVFIKVWQPDFLDCTQEDDRKSAKRVAAALNIPFEVLDAADAYKKNVVDEMTRSYAEGRTPNPDILCNQHIKFGILAQYAKEIGADHIATGHYAQVIQYEGTPCLSKAKDPAKDQVYFLAQVDPDSISRCIFPVGSMLKSETRALAQTFKLPVFDKKDSQGLCFMGMVDIAEFLAHTVALKDGEVLDVRGTVIGTHTGSQQFTLGQRHGFQLHVASHVPHYVTDVNVQNNTITVSEEMHAGSTRIELASIITFAQIKPEKKYDVQVRYHGELHEGTVALNGQNRVTVLLSKPHLIARGQVCAIYDGGVLVMSGIAL